MFEQLSENLEGVFARLRGRGLLTEADIKEGLREVRRVLLEADVNFQLTREFLERVEKKAVAVAQLRTVSPAQQLVKIVYDELTAMLGEQREGLKLSSVPPTVVMDTAGRLQIDEEMMAELDRLKEAVRPDEILLVADGMTGQEAVRIAEGFDQRLHLTGVILTKLDGDARGGAALSIYGVTKKPIKYIGVGEKSDALEDFYPERMASRILQQGDIVSLVEKAQEAFDADEAKKLEKKVRKQGMDLQDFLTAMKQIERLGPLEGVLKMLPGVNSKVLKQVKNTDPRRMKHLEEIVLSMTPNERKSPGILNGSRRARVAKGSGRPINEVNRLLDQFREMQKMMKKVAAAQGSGGKVRPGMFGMR